MYSDDSFHALQYSGSVVVKAKFGFFLIKKLALLSVLFDMLFHISYLFILLLSFS